MRSDYSLYLLAVVFFVITFVSALASTGITQTLLTLTSALLGILSLFLGILHRPKQAQTNPLPPPPPQTPPEPPQQPTPPKPAPIPQENLPPPPVPVKEETSLANPPATTTLAAAEAQVTTIQSAPKTPSLPAVMSQTSSSVSAQQTSRSQERSVLAGSDLTEVSGIGEKRANQLKILGVRCVEDLAKASVDDLARKLRISPKIVAKWVDSAKEFDKK